MDIIFEFIFDLIFEGSLEVSKNKKIPKYIRYPLIGMIILFFIAIIGLILFTGFLALKDNLFVGLFFIIIGLFMLIMSIIKFRKIYMDNYKS